jgi:hypothetical protein
MSAKHPYQEREQGIFTAVWKDKQVEYVQLTTFTAKIVREIIIDDGSGELHTQFVVEGKVDDRTERFQINAAEFSRMQWPLEKLGPSAVIVPGLINAQKAAAAIQLLSGKPAILYQISHSGWRLLDGTWRYLHSGTRLGRVSVSGITEAILNPTTNPTNENAGNSISINALPLTGRVGRVSDVEVHLDGGLENVYLPPLAPGDDLQALIRKTFDVLDVAPLTVTAPMFCALWRAVLGPVEFGIHYCGPSGSLKTAFLAIGQQFFGPRFSSNMLPGSWSSTGNALEGLLHDAKDIFVVIDDFAPQGAMNAAKLNAAAEQVFRAQGNGSGRGRARADGSRRPIRRPRGLVASTGEDMPMGYSLQARMMIPFVDDDSINPEKLSILQAEASSGTYAKVMGQFVDWLAPQYTHLQQAIASDVAFYRDQAKRLNSHRRQVDIVVNLVTGFNFFLKFASATGVISEEDCESRFVTIWEALFKVAQRQNRDLWTADPVERFTSLLRSALVGNLGHMCDSMGREPYNSIAWGWKWYPGASIEDKDGNTIATGTNRPMGECIGWIAGFDVYLDPETSYRVAKRAVGSGGEPLTVGLGTLKKRLLKHLKSHDLDTRETYMVRRTLQGTRREVLHLSIEFIIGNGISNGDDDQSLQEFGKLIDV